MSFPLLFQGGIMDRAITVNTTVGQVITWIIIGLLAGLLAGCTVQSNMGLPGSYTLPMPVRCSLWIFTEESHVQEWALALACPGIDLIRLFPWPPVQPWDESPSWDLEPESTPTPTPSTSSTRCGSGW